MAMKIILLVLISFFCLSGNPAFATVAENPVPELLNEAKQHFNLGDEETALDIYLNVIMSEPGNYEALWNASFIYTRKARRQATYTAQEELYRVALDYARLCLEIHPNRARSHYVYGLASAGLANEMPNSSERLRLIWDMKEHAELALQKDPEYAPAWHLMGLWHSKLANVSRTERIAARLLYGALPDGASNQKAEEFLRQAIAMDPDVIIYRLDLAKHYQETGQHSKAIPLLQSIFTMQPVSQNDIMDMLKARDRYVRLM